VDVDAYKKKKKKDNEVRFLRKIKLNEK